MCGSTTTNDKCINGTSPLTKPKFGPGMLLQHEDLEALHTYTRDLNRLLFRSLFGCGVICGLRVKPTEDCGRTTLVIRAGVALNCTGDPLHVPRDVKLIVDEDCAIKDVWEGWVLLCPLMKCCGPRQSMCGCDDEEPSTACTRERYGYKICVVEEEPTCACRCPPKPPPSTVYGKAQSRAQGTPVAFTLNEEVQDVATGGQSTPPPTGGQHPAQTQNCIDCGPCHKAHYEGECTCECGDCSGGGCDCVVLAKVTYDGKYWKADHSVRRVIRPALIADREPVDETAQADQDGATAIVAQPIYAAPAQKKQPARTLKTQKTSLA